MTEPAGRVLALDIGSARVGVAISDPRRLIAQGLAVWPTQSWRTMFDECVGKYGPALVLVGMPFRTDGSAGPEAMRVADIMDELRGTYPELEFQAWDERFTTVMAQRALVEADVSRRGRKKSVDKVAATLILQSWLERELPYSR